MHYAGRHREHLRGIFVMNSWAWPASLLPMKISSRTFRSRLRVARQQSVARGTASIENAPLMEMESVELRSDNLRTKPISNHCWLRFTSSTQITIEVFR